MQNGNNSNAHIASNIFFATNDFISDLNSTFSLIQNSSVMKFEISNVPAQVGNLKKIIWTIDTDKGVKMYSLVVNNFSFAQNNSLTAYLAFSPEETNIVANGRCAITLFGNKMFQCITNVPSKTTYQANQTYTTQFGTNGSSYVEKFNEIFLKSGYKVRQPEIEPSGKQHTITIPAEGNFIFTHDLPLGVTVTPNIKAESEWPEGKYQLFSFKDIDGTQLRLINCRWVRDNYFVMFFISDSHYNSYCTNDECKSYVHKSMALQYDATKFFEPYPGFKINYRPSIVVHGGDVASNRTSDIDNFQNIFAEYYNNNIPFIMLYGNHDWDPVHWGSSITGDDWGNNITGANSNEKTLNNVRAALNRSANLGVTDIKYYKGNTNGYYDVLPFTFKFRTVRFYCGQTYWYKQWYSPNRHIMNFFGLSNKLAANYYNTDRLINTLESDVKTWKNDPAVWVQHYPLNSNEW